ncbi:MAG: hypothetical protein ACHRHE_05100 [Tepidisphaerales bacterium]
MVISRQSAPNQEPQSRSRVLELAFWGAVVLTACVLVVGRNQQQNRWDGYVKAQDVLLRSQMDRSEGLRVFGIYGLILRDDKGRLWCYGDYGSLTIRDRDGREYAVGSAPIWLRLSVCEAPAWLVAIDYTARFAWIVWIPLGVLALAGWWPRLSVELLLAAALAAFVCAALDVWICRQTVVAAHLVPLYLGFPLSIFLLVWTRSRQAGLELAAEPVIATPVPEIVGDRPDWATITRDVHCPLCGYNLRGLERPLCPECGLQFHWAELFEAARTRHPYLYEHRPWWSIRAFLKTMFAGLNPGRFWREISPVHRVLLGRLLLYFLVCQALVAAPMAAGLVLERVRLASRVGPMWPVSLRQSGTEFFGMVLSMLYARIGDSTFYWCVAFVSWPLVTLAVLMVCQTTFRQAGVKTMHVVRAVIYGGDVIALAGAPTAGVCLGAIPFPELDDCAAFIVVLITLTMYPLLVLRLATACRLYLRIRHAWATALATQTVFLLGVALLRVMTWAR